MKNRYIRFPNNYLYYFYTIPTLILSIAGIIISIYLSYLHFKNYTDPYFSSFCALSRSINCDTVSQSPWSIFFGIPISIWGFFAYLLFFTIYLQTKKIKNHLDRLWFILLILSFCYSLFSLYLGYISTSKIKAYCILCVVSYAINFFLLFNCIIIVGRFTKISILKGITEGFLSLFNKKFISTIFVLIVGILSFVLFFPHYWKYDFPSFKNNTKNGITREGHPWIGAENPTLTIHEYTDYQCFQCGKMHVFLRRLISDYPNKIRLVHHHYPMDHEFNPIIVPEPFHIGSGKMAMIAIYAATQGKFWVMNDSLYAIARHKRPFNTKTLETITGIPSGELAAATQHQIIKQRLLNDIREGMKLRITGTPSYVINDIVYQGNIPKDILKKLVK